MRRSESRHQLAHAHGPSRVRSLKRGHGFILIRSPSRAGARDPAAAASHAGTNPECIGVNATRAGATNREAVRAAIWQGAGLSGPYILMNMLAAVLAVHGLFENSPAVVIGAMIVALLLGPIAGLGLAIVDGDLPLLSKSLLALIAGTVSVIVIALVLGWAYRASPLTHEVLSRTAPNLMDLMIALAGGAAGAVAMVRPKLGLAMVGVAIATALVPPLCAGGILLVRGEWRLAGGAFLLALTNMVGIQIAAAIVLWLDGYRRARDTSAVALLGFARRDLPSLILLGILSGILTLNLRSAVARQVFESRAAQRLREEVASSPGSRLASVHFDRTHDKTIAWAVVRAPMPPSPAQVARMEDKLPRPPDGSAIVLRVRFVSTSTIDRDGPLFEDETFAPEP
ncbi:MAG: TIGR00341 family protein [Polyangiaceae bacterium]